MGKTNPFADWRLEDVERHNARIAEKANRSFQSDAKLGDHSLLRGRETRQEPHKLSGLGVTPGPATNRFAKFKRRERGERNKLEAAYELHLATLERAGEIGGFMFEGIKLKLADNTHYTPDFIVYAKDGVVELHDTKGTTTKKRASGSVKAPWIEEDARIKLKVVAERFPFRTFAVFKTKDGWQKQQF